MSKYCDMPICDLRYLNDPEAIRQIEKICDIAQLILPSDAPDKVMSAFAAIPKEDIASILYIPKNTKLNMVNGVGSINAAPGTESFTIVNGVALVRNVADDAKINLNVNGFCMIDEKLKNHPGIVLNSVSGSVIYCDLGIDPKFYLNKITFDANTVQYLKKGQSIVVVNELVFEEDVSVELLLEKELTIIVGNKLKTPRHLAGYLKATATIGNKLEIID